jgi:hypothetical protein
MRALPFFHVRLRREAAALRKKPGKIPVRGARKLRRKGAEICAAGGRKPHLSLGLSGVVSSSPVSAG